jgi:murein DD-endopeptidase MepM/ murein hydrolase activator NlpD
MRPRPRAAVLLPALLLLPADTSSAQDVVRRVGRYTITAETGAAYPGGLIVARLRASRPIVAIAYANIDGRRFRFLQTPAGLRALVPLPVDFTPGPTTLGVELVGRGRIRIPVPVTVAPRAYPPRVVVIPEWRRPLLASPRRVRDSRQLLLTLRTVTTVQQWRGAFQPPVDVPPATSFGSPQTYIGGSPVEGMMDSVYGEYHRGLDYDVPEGTTVQAPAAGTVLLAGPLALTGNTLVIDHGQGVISVFYHLSRIDVAPGQQVESRAPVGLSGESGLAVAPHLHWGVYVSGVAVDPRVLDEKVD